MLLPAEQEPQRGWLMPPSGVLHQGAHSVLDAPRLLPSADPGAETASILWGTPELLVQLQPPREYVSKGTFYSRAQMPLVCNLTGSAVLDSGG